MKLLGGRNGLFQPKLRQTFLLNGAMGKREIAAGGIIEATDPNAPPEFVECSGDTSVIENETATFTVVVMGADSLQWQVSTDGGTGWTNIPGETGPSLSFTATLGDDGNMYRCVATNANGTTISCEGTLTIIPLAGTGWDDGTTPWDDSTTVWDV